MTPDHGRSRYTQGCRCEVCTAANLAYHRAYMEARPQKAQEHRERSREGMRRLRAQRKAEAKAKQP